MLTFGFITAAIAGDFTPREMKIISDIHCFKLLWCLLLVYLFVNSKGREALFDYYM